MDIDWSVFGAVRLFGRRFDIYRVQLVDAFPCSRFGPVRCAFISVIYIAGPINMPALPERNFERTLRLLAVRLGRWLLSWFKTQLQATQALNKPTRSVLRYETTGVIHVLQ